MTSAISASTRALPTIRAAPAPVAKLVNVVNGVAKGAPKPSLVQKALVTPSISAVSGGGGLAGSGSPAAPLTVDMGYLGYDHRGVTSALSDINASDGEMPTITVKAQLIKGFSYSLTSSFSYLRYAKAPSASLTALGPDDTQAKALSLKGGSFIAKASGDYTFTWSLKNGARFDGAFSATLDGKAPALPKTTGSNYVDALLQRGSAWWHDKGTTPTLSTTQVMAKVFALSSGSSRQALTYSFISAQTVPADILKNDFPATSQDKVFAEMDTQQKEAVKAALRYISAVTNLSFSEATDGGGNLQLGNYNMDPEAGGLSGMDGVSNLPDSYPLTDKVYTFLNSNPNSGLGDSTPGTKGWSDIWHEIGHALGLKHPGNYEATDTAVTRPFLPVAMDNKQYSIMSYKTNANTQGLHNQSLMLYDVAALQYLYGVNGAGSTALGDVGGAGGSFSFSDTAPVSTLYSATGKDTIDLSGSDKGSAVNLNAGTYSSINNLSAQNGAALQNSGKQNVAIAFGSSINKVSLSTLAANDTVVLNRAFKQGGFDEISNLQTGDRIALSQSLFGRLSTKNIELNTSGAASSKDSRIVVNKSTGDVFYDADGAGTKSSAVKIAAYKAVQGAEVALSTFVFVA